MRRIPSIPSLAFLILATAPWAAELSAQDGERWLQCDIPEAERPQERSFHAMAYLPSTGETVLFGGGAGGAPPLDREEKSLPGNMAPGTWTYSACEWRLRNFPVEPPLRIGHSMVTDPKRDRIVLFGGAFGTLQGQAVNLTLLNDVWEYDGTGWTQITPPNSPPPRVGAAMAYDYVRETIILYGGSTGVDLESIFTDPLGDMWEWDGTDWTPVDLSQSPDPGPRGFAAMASSEQQGEMLMCGGDVTNGTFGSSDDVWIWNGETWAQVLPSGPTAFFKRAGHTLVYDTIRDLYVCFGGRGNGAGSIANLQQFDPVLDQWSTVLPPGGSDPSPWRPTQRFAAASFDQGEARMVQFGGETSAVSAPIDDNETWVFFGPALGSCTAIDVAVPVDPPIPAGCPSSNGLIPDLGCFESSRPIVGETWQLSLGDLPNGLPPILTIGSSREVWNSTLLFLPLELRFLGMDDCWLVASPDRTRPLPVPTPDGVSRADFPIANSEDLIGLRLYVQALVIDPDIAGVGGNTIGVVLSNGLDLRIGEL